MGHGSIGSTAMKTPLWRSKSESETREFYLFGDVARGNLVPYFVKQLALVDGALFQNIDNIPTQSLTVFIGEVF